jgi:uncharacterized repeat protein (TIGR03806 family)
MHGASRVRVFGLISVLLARSVAAWGDPPKVPEPSGRVPWTTSRIAGTPEPPPPYRAEPALPKLKFTQPVVLTTAEGIDRVFVVELGGKVVSFPNDPGSDKTHLAIDMASACGAAQVYGMAFHPGFARKREVFLCYITRQGGPEGTRVSRFKVERSDPPRIDPKSEEILITWLAGGHNAGCLAFGPDGFLYIATGDAAEPSPPDPLDTGQDISDLLSSILRIDVDRRDPGKPYRVPPDNPFVGLKGARPEIWAFGFRNPWRFSFDRRTGDLWAGDVGWELWEMVFKITRGGNYGWSLVEGPQPVKPEGRRGPGPVIPPVVVHPHSEAASVTGGYVYRGPALKELVGAFVYGDFQSGKVWGLRHDGTKVVWHKELAETPIQLVSFGEDARGELYLLDYERTGQVYRLVPNHGSGPQKAFPRTLSETGLFASTRDHSPAPGVVPYEINAALWCDHATAKHLLAVPGAGRVTVDPSGRWKAPEGTVLARTVSLELERGKPESRRRLETQVLHFEEGTWRPYTYVWNDAQTDAALADAKGSSLSLAVRDPAAPGGQRVQKYKVAARSECLLCHNPWVERQTTVFGRQTASPLAFTTEQLDRETSGAGNQLERFERFCLLDRPTPASRAGRSRLADPYDRSAGLDARARAYVQVNCAHCHQFGAGGSTTILLSAALPLDETKTVGVKPVQGTFGIDGAQVIAPGDPEGSVLYYRISKLGGGRMPRTGSDVVDVRGVELIHDWIAQLPGPVPEPDRAPAADLGSLRKGAPVPSAERAGAIARLLGSTRGALLLMRAIDEGALDEAARREAITAANAHPRAEVRDLFERFVPESERVRRLGAGFDPKDVLSLGGDPARGERLFASDATQCRNCHRAGPAKDGSDLGPDLAGVGSKYDRPTLLRHIIEPSLAVDQKYVNYLLETKAGKVHSGLLVSRTDREVVLKDARNETVRVPVAEVERIEPAPTSLMPESLLRDLTAQQAADLLDFLASLKVPGR